MKLHSTRSSFEDVILTARPAFSARSWPYLMAMLLPWVLCAGQRCVTRLAALASHRRSLSGYYRFLSEGKVRVVVLFRVLFELIRRTFPTPALTLVVDDTLVPKWGKGIFGTASHFDQAQRRRAGFIWGHDWVVLAVVVQVGACAWVALPFWIALYRPKKTVSTAREFRTRLDLTIGALRAVREWFSGPIVLLADGAYNNASLLLPLREMGIEMVSRLRSDARLRSTTIPRRPRGKRGRKPTYGPRLAPLATLARARSAFREIRVAIYGKTVTLLVREIDAYWIPLRAVVKVVITRDPRNPKRVAFLMTTDLARTAQAVVEEFGRRWTVEQLFSVLKVQLGLDSAEVRKEQSVRRHAALTLALATWLEIWAWKRSTLLRARSFATKLAALRQEVVTRALFESTPRTTRSRRIAKGVASLFATATGTR